MLLEKSNVPGATFDDTDELEALLETLDAAQDSIVNEHSEEWLKGYKAGYHDATARLAQTLEEMQSIQSVL